MNNPVMPDIGGLLIVITALGLLSFVAVTMTSFVKISVVLFLLRNALGMLAGFYGGWVDRLGGRKILLPAVVL